MKKPLPLIARSRLLSVKSMLPWLNCCETFATFTPLPMAVELTPCWDDANRSANSAREPLKPVVATLAMLFAVTVRSDWAALRPESARRKGILVLLLKNGGSEDAADVCEGDRARAGIQGERAGRGVDRDAADFAHEQRIERLVLAADRCDGRERVLAGRGGDARVGLAVP